VQVSIYKPELPPYELVEHDIREMYASGMLYPGQFTQRLIEEVEQFCGVKHVLR
jgi:dTDP-4-amino-4,6-dideoxygalactose transaminase